MMMSWFYILCFYLMTLLVFFNYSNPLMFWMMMELNLLSFSLIFLLSKEFIFKQDSLNYLVYYFLIQSSASILFLSNFCFSDWGSIFNVDSMFLVSMLLKIGLFPFFFWMYNISWSLCFLSLFFLLTFQKIPLLLGLFCCSSPILFYFLLLSFVLGSLILFFSDSFVYMLISSSISYSFILFLSYSYSFMFFLIFFLLYSAFIGLILNYYFFKNSISQGFLFLAFSFFMGLPPLSLFFFKFLVSTELMSLMGPMETLFFWGVSFVSLVGYLKFFYFSFYKVSLLYMNKKCYLKIFSLFYLIFSSFFIFLC